MGRSTILQSQSNIRREGDWHNLSYGHHLGYGARPIVARALDPLVEKFKATTDVMGQTAFKDALKLAPSLWVNCDGEWGRGPGYRDRVADWNQQFGAAPRRELEQELAGIISREWAAPLNRLSSLLETDAPK